MSFAGAVRLLAEGRLGPLDTLRLMLLFMPPMLQYALPFAAGFGATLAYHRWSNDNEITACHAAGISHRSLLAPVLISGLALAVVIFALQNSFIPRFLRSIEQLITRDAARYIIGSIERKEAVNLNGTLIYADVVREVPSPDAVPYDQLYMKRLMVIKLDDHKQPEIEISAEEADVWLVREDASALSSFPGAPATATAPLAPTDSVTRVIVKPRGVRARSIGQQGSDLEYTLMSYVIPNAFNDDPKFLTWSQLEALKRNPDAINFIESRRRVLASHICERLTTTQISDELATPAGAHFIDRNGQPFFLRAASIHWDSAHEYWAISPPAAGPIQLVRTLDGGRTLTQSAESAWLRTAVNPADPDNPVTLTIQLQGVRSTLPAAPTPDAPRSSTRGSLREFVLDAATLQSSPTGAVMSLSSSDLIALAAQRVSASPDNDLYIASPRSDLLARLADLHLEIISKQHERLASSLACLVMIVTGAVMALRLRSRLPLTVYLWAFFPALFAVLTISAGQQTTHHSGLAGLIILWGGVAALLVYTFLQYRKVAAH